MNNTQQAGETAKQDQQSKTAVKELFDFLEELDSALTASPAPIYPDSLLHYKLRRILLERDTAESAPHAEGQKATVEAKSAGVWVRPLTEKNRPGVHGKVVIVRNFKTGFVQRCPNFGHDKGWGVGMDRSFFWDNTEWLDETPTSHAEGEKGAMGFAEWIAQEKWEWYSKDNIWYKWYSEGETLVPFVRKTTLELYNLYLTC